ncbi:hypothetical protein DKK68_06445 [Bifidobacterium asteroides]|uniref:hypothetical protein n=1 Tax=Bifidobacterium asteroides TaxID=1684 RepID=UPI000D784C0E|nr:hypothetical protein [Bifidobacterium asteroides]PXY87395.1 hypothetical protein DKK68_06445 [Bifidobacterium asteroides]
MSRSIEELKSAEYWSIPQASAVMNIPRKRIRQAVADKDLPVKYFDSSLAKIRADDVRAWAAAAPDEPGGEWDVPVLAD